jgi:hypothetical protein
MTKLREIADKLGLPINKSFLIEDSISGLTFKINEKGETLFYHEEKEKWIISAWSLIDVYVKGYTLINIVKENNKDDEYYTNIRLALIDYHDAIVEELKATIDIIHISLLRETKWKAFDLIKQTEERLLNK